MKAYFRKLLTLSIAASAVAACGSGGLVLPSDSAGEALFQQAEQHLADEKWGPAATAFDTLLRNYPTSPHLPAARIGLGRAYYQQNRSDSYILAIDAFRNFMTYHPTHQLVDFAELMIGLSYMGLMRSPDRDQSNTVNAFESLSDFVEDNPDSQYVQQARERLAEVIDTLSEHELQVARFWLSTSRYGAAAERAQYALRKYGTTQYRCELLYVAGESFRRGGDEVTAEDFYQRVVDEHGDCRFAEDARERLRRGGATR